MLVQGLLPAVLLHVLAAASHCEPVVPSLPAHHHHARPPVALLPPASQARQLLFYPTEDDMRLYPQLLAMPPAAQPQPQPQPGGQGQGDAAPPAAPQLRVQICALTSLYLVHSKRWDRVQPFIEAGGLRWVGGGVGGDCERRVWNGHELGRASTGAGLYD